MAKDSELLLVRNVVLCLMWNFNYFYLSLPKLQCLSHRLLVLYLF